MSASAGEVRVTEPTDIDLLLDGIRPSDLDEIRASTLVSPRSAVYNSFRLSRECHTGWIDGRLVCVFGVGSPSMLSRVGTPWLIGTGMIDRYPGIFLHHSKQLVRRMLSRYEVLQNYVDARNLKAIRWLEWLGFELGREIPYGPYLMPFHLFQIRRDDVS